jgi:hypothetical protein
VDGAAHVRNLLADRMLDRHDPMPQGSSAQTAHSSRRRRGNKSGSELANRLASVVSLPPTTS